MKLLRILRTVVLGSLVLFVGTVSPVEALPGSYVDTVFYDQNFGIIGEHEILCSGAHNIWGSQTGVFKASWSESCDTGQGATTCYYMSSSQGYFIPYQCDEPPPCGFDVTCP